MKRPTDIVTVDRNLLRTDADGNLLKAAARGTQIARAEYDELAALPINAAVKGRPQLAKEGEAPPQEPAEKTYADMTKAELLVECATRGIEVPKRPNNDTLIALLT